MPTLTVRFNPAQDTYESIISVVNAAFAVEDKSSPEDTEESTEGTLPNGWTSKRLRKYMLHLKSDEAFAALRVIAEEAPQVSFDEVQSRLGYKPSDASVYGGMMSTFGHAVNSTPGVEEKPFYVNYSTRTYEMNEALAKVAVAHLDDMGY